ncbi:hypothetical protein B0J13DRAFT_530739 [Dactylonectria estremocensis]|uniref:Uncharacterized protein n=1 Tax=Dactylonectria estremocensis TaxID=1079267 RepID=A0A9P9DZE2_9HYPO|nr:hypothetical protein B0J13DRAFT_530739 [Dactylonectria estremocensis]
MPEVLGLVHNIGLALAIVAHAFRFIPARCLHVGMLIVCCMAWAGPGAEDATQYVQMQKSIRFPAVGKSVQQGEIALTVLCFVFDPAISILFYRWGGRVSTKSRKSNPDRAKSFVLFVQTPWYIASLAGWVVCVVFQASYVPILGRKKLELCNTSNPAQCKMVTASWILSIFFWQVLQDRLARICDAAWVLIIHSIDHFILIFLCVCSVLGLPARQKKKEGIDMWRTAAPTPVEQQPIKMQPQEPSGPPSYRSRELEMDH